MPFRYSIGCSMQKRIGTYNETARGFLNGPAARLKIHLNWSCQDKIMWTNLIELDKSLDKQRGRQKWHAGLWISRRRYKDNPAADRTFNNGRKITDKNILTTRTNRRLNPLESLIINKESKQSNLMNADYGHVSDSCLCDLTYIHCTDRSAVSNK